jgi:hypothetical protein
VKGEIGSIPLKEFKDSRRASGRWDAGYCCCFRLFAFIDLVGEKEETDD